MAELIAFLSTLFVMVPIIAFIFIFIGSKIITKHSRKSFHISVDASTILFIFSVHFLILTIWGKSLFLLIILFILMMLFLFTFIYWKMHQEIHIRKIFKGVWRLQFLIFFLLYFILILFGMVHRVLTNLAV